MKTEQLEQNDPRGTIECAGCDALGRPEGGVTYARADQRISIGFTLPLGWAVAECAVWCTRCATTQQVQALRRAHTPGELAAAVAPRAYGGSRLRVEERSEQQTRREYRERVRRANDDDNATRQRTRGPHRKG